VKRSFILMPMILPRISDHAAVQLLDILEHLLASVRHHYEPQITRWQRRQSRAEPAPHRSSSSPPADEPF
jgi:hypothetical protein